MQEKRTQQKKSTHPLTRGSKQYGFSNAAAQVVAKVSDVEEVMTHWRGGVGGRGFYWERSVIGVQLCEKTREEMCVHRY